VNALENRENSDHYNPNTTHPKTSDLRKKVERYFHGARGGFDQGYNDFNRYHRPGEPVEATIARVITMPGKRIRYSKRGRLQRLAKAYIRKKYRTGGIPFVRGAYNMRLPTELKLVDQQAMNGVLLQNAPTIANNQLVLLNSIAQGTDYTTRIGRVALATSIQFRLTVYQTPATSTASNQGYVRAILFCDRQPNGTEPTVVGDLLSTTFRPDQAFKNLSNRDRFNIILDKTFHWADWNNATPEYLGGAKNQGHKVWNVYKKLHVDKTVYSGTGTGISNIQSCALYFVVWNTISNNVTQANFAFRLRFTDS